MAWQDRLQEAAYTPPGGARITFAYEDVARSVDKKASAFEFPDSRGTYVQDNGTSGRRYPMRVFIWGENYDLAANGLLEALSATGEGLLEHPVYGNVKVIPVGSITQRDDLVREAGQAVFEIEFWETTGLVYPSGLLDPGPSVLGAVKKFNNASALEFAQNVLVNTENRRQALKNVMNTLRGAAAIVLGPIAATKNTVEALFNDINDSINEGIDILIGEPLTLAFQTLQLIQAPGRAAALISDRLDAYRNLARSLTDRPEKTPLQAYDLYATGYVSGAIVSAVNNKFLTRPEAIAAADEILAQLDVVTAWRDAAFDEVGAVDTGGSYQAIRDAAALCAGFLVQISFSLKQERRIILDRPRAIIELVTELYEANDDETVNLFINSNDLSGSEILTLPKGRSIVYYV